MYLGVDIGSSFIKVAILDTGRSQVRNVTKVETPAFLPAPNPLYREISPEQTLAAVRTLIDWYLERSDRGDLEDHEHRIEGILFSTQMHGFLLMDESGNAVCNYVTWQDERATEPLREADSPAGSALPRQQSATDCVRELLDDDDVRRSGMPVKPSLATCTLYHWRHNEGARLGVKTPLWFCTIGDYVIAALAQQRPRAHITNAAATGLVDLETGDWSSTVGRKLGFDFLRFPDLAQDNEPCGFYQAGTRRIALYPSFADHQSSMFGAHLEPEADLAINMGTGSQICVVSNTRTHGEYETRPFFDGCYLRAIPHIPAGRSLNLLAEFIQDTAATVCGTKVSKSAVWERIQPLIAEAAAVQDAPPETEQTAEPQLDVNISYFRTSAVPQDGAIRNIRERNLTLGNLFLAAFRDMARNYEQLHRRLTIHGTSIERIVCTGGLAERHPVLRRCIEARFGLPCTEVPYAGDALAGLLRLAHRMEQREARR